MALSTRECLLPTREHTLLRATLLRRVAELSFRGHAFVDLPREVMKEVKRDIDGTCDAVAAPLAELFCHTLCPFVEDSELALYADPAFWRYGLLLFCSNMCTAQWPVGRRGPKTHQTQTPAKNEMPSY